MYATCDKGLLLFMNWFIKARNVQKEKKVQEWTNKN